MGGSTVLWQWKQGSYVNIVGNASLLSLSQPSTPLHTHVHMHTCETFRCVLRRYSDGVVTLTSSAQGGICPGEEVTLTCTVTGGVSLEWSSTAFSPVVRFVGNDPIGQPIDRGIFTATLISALTSTLRVNATPEAMLNGTVVTCSDQLNPMSVTLTLAGGLIVYCSCQCCKQCMIVASSPGHSQILSRSRYKIWEWPGDEASMIVHLNCEGGVLHVICSLTPSSYLAIHNAHKLKHRKRGGGGGEGLLQYLL